MIKKKRHSGLNQKSNSQLQDIMAKFLFCRTKALMR